MKKVDKTFLNETKRKMDEKICKAAALYDELLTFLRVVDSNKKEWK